MKQNLEKTLIITASVCLFYLIIITAFYTPYYNQDLYEKNFEKAYQTLGKEKTDKIFSDLKQYHNEDYFGYERFYLLSEFTEDEKNHLRDVKVYLDWICILYYVAMLILGISLFILFKNKKKPYEILTYGGAASLALILIIGIFSLLGFDSFFTFFHKIFFPQGNWQFPPNSLIITLFPQEFFHSFALRMSSYALLFSLISLGVGIKNKKKKK